jgi:hypothetical protein
MEFVLADRIKNAFPKSPYRVLRAFRQPLRPPGLSPRRIRPPPTGPRLTPAQEWVVLSRVRVVQTSSQPVVAGMSSGLKRE